MLNILLQTGLDDHEHNFKFFMFAMSITGLVTYLSVNYKRRLINRKQIQYSQRVICSIKSTSGE